MMDKKDNKKLAKLIFSASLINNRIDETRFNKLIKLMKASGSKRVLPILEYLKMLIQQKQSKEQLQVESAFELDSVSSNLIHDKFEKMLNKKLLLKMIENKDLIAGIRVKNADYIWENSIRNNLEQLKDGLTNG